MKRPVPLDQAAAMVPDGAVVMVGRCLGAGSPMRLIDELGRPGRKRLTGAWRSIVGMTHRSRTSSRTVPRCRIPLTLKCQVHRVVKERAILRPNEVGLRLEETPTWVSVQAVIDASDTSLILGPSQQ